MFVMVLFALVDWNVARRVLKEITGKDEVTVVAHRWVRASLGGTTSLEQRRLEQVCISDLSSMRDGSGD